MAHRVISLLRSDSVAFGCEADMRTVARSNQSDVNDLEADIVQCPPRVICSVNQSAGSRTMFEISRRDLILGATGACAASALHKPITSVDPPR
jgi:hypothetical protein